MDHKDEAVSLKGGGFGIMETQQHPEIGENTPPEIEQPQIEEIVQPGDKDGAEDDPAEVKSAKLRPAQADSIYK